VLTRDGNSSYFINNQPCVAATQDVFLGTGLGPRAYAIIGQGHQPIIESAPKSCACFSKKRRASKRERRRETETASSTRART
jgi:chromosome segregation protein